MYEIRKNGNVFEVTFGGREVMTFNADASYWIWAGRDAVRKVKITGCYGGLFDLVSDDKVADELYRPPSDVFPTARECIDARVSNLKTKIECLKVEISDCESEIFAAQMIDIKE